MLLSMTGQGQAQGANDRFTTAVEIRAVNNRFLKVNISQHDLGQSLGAKLESIVRQSVRRGSVHVQVHVTDRDEADQYQLNTAAIHAYRQQLQDAFPESAVPVTALLDLPGVVCENREAEKNTSDELAELVVATMMSAVENMNNMRQAEGQSMATELLRSCDDLQQFTDRLGVFAPDVAKRYAQRLQSRINQMLESTGESVEPKDLIREVGIFADRCDVTEELVRLASHIEQFRAVIGGDSDTGGDDDAAQNNGRKLDFLTQELLRETNTVGSKANHQEMSAIVVEMKTIIERIRELVQNVE